MVELQGRVLFIMHFIANISWMPFSVRMESYMIWDLL